MMTDINYRKSNVPVGPALSDDYVDILIMDHRNSKPKYCIPEEKIIYFNSEKAKAFKYDKKSTKFIKKLVKERKYNTVISFLDNINTVVSLSLFFFQNKKEGESPHLQSSGSI